MIDGDMLCIGADVIGHLVKPRGILFVALDTCRN